MKFWYTKGAEPGQFIIGHGDHQCAIVTAPNDNTGFAWTRAMAGALNALPAEQQGTPFLQAGDRCLYGGDPGRVTRHVGVRLYIELDGEPEGQWVDRDDPLLAHAERLTPPLTASSLMAGGET